MSARKKRLPRKWGSFLILTQHSHALCPADDLLVASFAAEDLVGLAVGVASYLRCCFVAVWMTAEHHCVHVYVSIVSHAASVLRHGVWCQLCLRVTLRRSRPGRKLPCLTPHLSFQISLSELPTLLCSVDLVRQLSILLRSRLVWRNAGVL